jgi:4-amino-4-deoxy-L-arabinose transferase-like glycosyltransferase
MSAPTVAAPEATDTPRARSGWRVPVGPPPERPLRAASRRFVIALGAIAVVALGVRLWFVFAGYGHFRLGGDAVYYHYQGWTIGDGHWFVTPGGWFEGLRATTRWHGHQGPTAYHPPLYGLYLGMISWLGGWSVTAHRVASCFLGTASVVVLGLSGRKMMGERAGLVAASIAAVYANLWINDGMLLSESMTILTVSVVLLAAYTFWARPSRWNAWWLGVAIGVAVLSRSEVSLLAIFVAVPVIAGTRRSTTRRRVEMLALAAGGIIVFVGPWVGFNMVRFEKPVYLTSGVGSVLSTANCDKTYYGPFLGLYAQCFTYPNGAVTGDESQQDAVVMKSARTYIKHHLGRVPVVVAARVARIWDVYKPGQNLQLNALIEARTKRASRIAFGQYVFLMPLAIAGTILLWRARIPISPILGPALVATVAAAVSFGVVRYRSPAEPAIVLAAAASVEVVWRSVRGRARPGPRAA